MKYEYTPVGTCSRKLVFDIEDDRIKSLEVTGGCPGIKNRKGYDP